jgi:hypothetical protein
MFFKQNPIHHNLGILHFVSIILGTDDCIFFPATKSQDLGIDVLCLINITNTDFSLKFLDSSHCLKNHESVYYN